MEFENRGFKTAVPVIRIDSMTSVQDIELELMSNHDEFFRQIIIHIMDQMDGLEPDPVAILVDEEENEYIMEIPSSGYVKSLTKANEYFISIEEYETCDLIKQMIEIANKEQL